MTDPVKVSQLPVAADLDGTEHVVGIQGGVTVRMPAQKVKNYSGGLGPSRYVPLIIFNGESNSGGYANNADATTAELSPRPAVQILNNISLVFEDLHIGVNNLLDHAGLPLGTHGFENGLAHSVENGEWLDTTLYLVKTGEGGSVIADWGATGTYFTKLKQRVAAARSAIAAMGKVPLVYVWYTLGINDAIAGTNEVAWKASIVSYFQQLRAEVGMAPIFMPFFMPSSTGFNFNDTLQALADEQLMVYVTPSTGATTRDANHWDYAGMKIVSANLVAATLGKFGQRSEYVESLNLFGIGPSVAGSSPVQAPSPGQVATPAFNPVAGTYGTAQTVALSCATAGASIFYTTDGSTPTSSSTAYTAPLSVAATTTIKAIATKATMTDSAVASATFTIGAAPAGTGDPSGLTATSVTWGSLQNASYVAPNLQCTGAIPSGAVSSVSLDASQQFVVECDIKADNSSDATVVYLDDDATADFGWVAGLQFVAGIYCVTGTLYGPVGGYAATAAGSTGGVDVTIRFYNSGNDLICEKSADGGATWTNVYTATGALAGKTALYLKTIFAAAGSARVAVRQSPNQQQVALPTFTPAAGTYGTAQNVTIDCSTAGAAIYYTTDGSVPTAASTAYTAPVSISSTTTLKAIATKAGMTNSVVASGVFTIGAAATGDPSGLTPAAVTWTALQNATYSAPNLQNNGTTPSGAVSGTALDATKQFVVEWDLSTDGSNDGVVVYIDDDSTADFVWQASLQFVAGLYLYQGGLNGPVGGYAAPAVGTLGAATAKARFYNSSNDLICEQSVDGGATWTNIYTAAGALAGKTTLYVKALFAIGGSAHIAVRQASAP